METEIWGNRFINNNPQGSSQVLDSNTFSKQNEWNTSEIGNFWSDHVTPDDDGDGIVDIPYTVGTTSDFYPCTNINFDIVKPEVEITAPESQGLTSSYVWAEWTAEDDFGIRKVEISQDNSTWMDVTGKLKKSLFVTPDLNTIYVKATDNNGLFNFDERTYTLSKTYDVLKISNPSEGSFIPDDPVTITWTIEDYFTVTKQTVTVDGVPTDISTSSRSHDLDLEEGEHLLTISIVDDDDLTFDRTVEFTVDRNAPSIVLNSPMPFSTLSNSIIVLDYLITDQVGLATAEMRIDDGEWEDILDTTSRSVVLSRGEHNISLIATDLIGFHNQITVPFTIGENTNILFDSLINGSFTNKENYIVNWDYNGPLNWSHASLKKSRTSEFIDIGINKSWEIPLQLEGVYEITVRLHDPYGNYWERMTTLIKDSTSPSVAFKEVGEYLNRTEIPLEWQPFDNFGIEGFRLKIDEGDWIDIGTNRSIIVTLEDGEHEVSIEAIDHAGNTGQNSISFTIDTYVPIVEFLEPADGIILTDPSIEIKWKVTEDIEINSTFISINGGPMIDVFGRTSYTLATSEEGEKVITVYAGDLAGNVGMNTVTMTLDLSAPIILWGSNIVEITNNGWIELFWNITDNLGLEKITLSYGDENVNIELDQTGINLTLGEGSYEFTLTAVDIAGLSASSKLMTDVLIDLTPPTIQIVEATSGVKENMYILEWTSGDNGSGLLNVEVKLDSGPFQSVEILEGKRSFGPFEDGHHTLTIRVYDVAGNHQDVVREFDIGEKGSGGGGDEGSSLGMIIAIVVVVIIVIIIVGILAFIFLRKKSHEEIEEGHVPEPGVEPEHDEKPQEGLPPAAPVQPPELMASEKEQLPPAELQGNEDVAIDETTQQEPSLSPSEDSSSSSSEEVGLETPLQEGSL